MSIQTYKNFKITLNTKSVDITYDDKYTGIFPNSCECVKRENNIGSINIAQIGPYTIQVSVIDSRYNGKLDSYDILRVFTHKVIDNAITAYQLVIECKKERVASYTNAVDKMVGHNISSDDEKKVWRKVNKEIDDKLDKDRIKAQELHNKVINQVNKITKKSTRNVKCETVIQTLLNNYAEDTIPIGVRNMFANLIADRLMNL